MLDNNQLVALSSVIGLVIVVLLIWGVSWALNKLGKGDLLDVIYDAKGYPSLSKFQFLAWTLIVIGAFTIVALIRLLGSALAVDFQYEELPENLVYLLGISVSVVPVSTNASKRLYGDTTTQKKNTPVTRKPFETILTENENPSLTKFQMFSWTIVSIVIYIVLFARMLMDFATGSTINGDPVGIFLPDIDFALVALMGLSQAAYVSGKWVLPKNPLIKSVDPEEVMIKTLSSKDIKFTVRGLNFGNTKDTILIGSTTIDSKQITWGENRIVFTLESGPQWRNAPSEMELKLLIGTKEATHKIRFTQ